MVDFIEEIYRYANLIPFFKEIIEKCREDDSKHVMTYWKDSLDTVTDFCKEISQMDAELANAIWKQLENACAHTTGSSPYYCMMGDDLEIMLPLLYKAMSLLGEIDVTEGDYRLFSSKSGFLSLQNVVTGKYVHSCLDPMEEARCIARNIYTVNQQNCRIMGCGLGYLAYQFYAMSHGRFDVYIYEKDATLIDYAYQYGVLSWIPEDKLHIIVDENEESLAEAVLEDKIRGLDGRTAYYCYDDIYMRMVGVGKQFVENLSTTVANYYRLRELAESNFARNLENVSKTVYEIKDQYENDDWIVVAGGPSVDEQLDYIKSNVGKKKIIVATTIYKKMVDNGIKVDYVVILDPYNRAIGHMNGVTDMSAPILINAVGNWQYAEYYTGDKYLVPCSGHEMVTKHFEPLGVSMIDVGSSVSVMCIYMALFFKARRVELIGLDLSYPNNKSHATGTMDYVVFNRDSYPEVECVAGGMVKTRQEFLYYLNEVEEIIATNKQIEFVNYSNGGAVIKGAKWYKE